MTEATYELARDCYGTVVQQRQAADIERLRLAGTLPAIQERCDRCGGSGRDHTRLRGICRECGMTGVRPAF